MRRPRTRHSRPRRDRDKRDVSNPQPARRGAVKFRFTGSRGCGITESGFVVNTSFDWATPCIRARRTSRVVWSRPTSQPCNRNSAYISPTLQISKFPACADTRNSSFHYRAEGGWVLVARFPAAKNKPSHRSLEDATDELDPKLVPVHVENPDQLVGGGRAPSRKTGSAPLNTSFAFHGSTSLSRNCLFS